MSYYQFVTQETEFWEQINHCIATNQHDPEILSQLKNKAQTLLKVDAYAGYVALGMIASLEGDAKAIHSYYQQAIEDFSRKPDLLASYAESLARVGHFSHAAELMLEAYYLSPSTLHYLDNAIHLCSIVGRFQFIGELLRIWTKIYPYQAHQFANRTHQIIQWMEENKVTDNNLEELINLALSILQHHCILVSPQQIDISLDQETQKLFYKIRLSEKKETILELTTELVQKIIATHLPKVIEWQIVPKQ